MNIRLSLPLKATLICFVFIWGITGILKLEKTILFHQKINDYFFEIIPFMLIGILIGAVINLFISNESIAKYVGQNNIKSIFYAFLFSLITLGCSHGAIAIAIGIYKKGASMPAVIGYMMLAPWSNPSILIILFSVLQWLIIPFILSVLIISFITALIFSFPFLQAKWMESTLPKSTSINCCNNEDSNLSLHSNSEKIILFKKYSLKDIPLKLISEIVSLSNIILWWSFIGILLAAFLNVFIPTTIYQYITSQVSGLFITLGVASIIEICSDGMIPMAIEVYRQTHQSLGYMFVFLIAGVATDYTEIAIIWKNIGRKQAIWLPIITIPQIILFAYCLNLFF